MREYKYLSDISVVRLVLQLVNNITLRAALNFSSPQLTELVICSSFTFSVKKVASFTKETLFRTIMLSGPTKEIIPTIENCFTSKIIFTISYKCRCVLW